jgi:hypothetical protein
MMTDRLGLGMMELLLLQFPTRRIRWLDDPRKVCGEPPPPWLDVSASPRGDYGPRLAAQGEPPPRPQ